MTAAAAVAVAVAVACGGGGGADAPAADGAVVPDAVSDAGLADASRDSEAGVTGLLARGDIELFGITLDGYVAYRVRDAAQAKDKLVIASLSGEPPIVLSDDLGGGFWYTRVAGVAVAFWTGAGENNLGTFNVWTKATGIQSAPGRPSLLNFFAASFGSDMFIFASGVSDGGVVDGSVENVRYAATSAASFDPTAVIEDVNLAAAKNNCGIRALATYAESMFLPHCTGTNPGAVFGRVVLAKHQPDGKIVTSLLLSETSATEAIIPFFGISSDRTGSKLFVVGAQPPGQGRMIDVATRQATALDPNVSEGVVSSDGGTVFYVSNGTFKRSATDGTQKVVLVDGGYDHTVAMSDDRRRFVYASSPTNLTDLQLADTTQAGQTPTTLLADAGAAAAAFLASGEEVAYVSVDPGTGRGDCRLVRADGGDTRIVGTDVRFCEVFPGSDVVLFGDNLRQLGPFVVMDLKMIDRSSGATAPVLIDTDVATANAFGTWDKQIAYVKKGAAGGLYARKLP